MTTPCRRENQAKRERKNRCVKSKHKSSKIDRIDHYRSVAAFGDTGREHGAKRGTNKRFVARNQRKASRNTIDQKNY